LAIVNISDVLLRIFKKKANKINMYSTFIPCYGLWAIYCLLENAAAIVKNTFINNEA
jgi:hypothetical protein